MRIPPPRFEDYGLESDLDGKVMQVMKDMASGRPRSKLCQRCGSDQGLRQQQEADQVSTSMRLWLMVLPYRQIC